MSDLSKRRNSCPSGLHNTHKKQTDHNDKYEEDNRRHFPDEIPTANTLFSKENRQTNANPGPRPPSSVCRSSFTANVSPSDRILLSSTSPRAACLHRLVTNARKPLTPESHPPPAALPSPPVFHLLALETVGAAFEQL